MASFAQTANLFYGVVAATVVLTVVHIAAGGYLLAGLVASATAK